MSWVPLEPAHLVGGLGPIDGVPVLCRARTHVTHGRAVGMAVLLEKGASADQTRLASGASGAHGIQHRCGEQWKERGEGPEHKNRDEDPHGAGEGQEADHKPDIDEYCTRGVATFK